MDHKMKATGNVAITGAPIKSADVTAATTAAPSTDAKKAADARRKMQELNPQSEAFRQWARAMRGYMGASRSRAAIEHSRLKAVHNAGTRLGKHDRIESLACEDEGLNLLVKRTAELGRLSVHERRRRLNGT